jgi:hypothetical protein
LEQDALKKILIVLAISTNLLICQPISSQAEVDKGPVTEIWGNPKETTSIANNLNWSRATKSEAAKAITYLKNELSGQLKNLANAGAVTASRKYISTSSSSYPDWSKFVPVFKQYVLIGKNKNGKVVSRSDPIPKNVRNLESMLIQMNADVCRIGAGASTNSTMISCSVSPVEESQYLRASLRSWMENYSNFETEEAGYFKKLLSTCLGNNFRYSIAKGKVNCPDNSKIWVENKEIPLNQNYSRFKYQIVIDAKRRTAVMTYLNRKTIDKAPEAKNTYGSMLMFSY